MLNSKAEGGPGPNEHTEETYQGNWREERRRWRDERREARRRYPFHGLFFGLVLVLLGVLFLLNRTGALVGDRWWQTLLIGLGGVFVVDGVAHYASRGYRWGGYGKIVTGIILAAVGVLFIIGLGQWWPLALIVAGAAVLLRMVWRHSADH